MEIAILTDFPELAGALIKSMLLTAMQLVAFLGVFLLVGFWVDLMERKRNGWLRKSVGEKGIYTTALIGVPIHELGHVVMCWVFGHKVEQVKFVQFGDPDGTMGYVNHSYEPTNLFHRIGLFFIGIAPILMGITFISLTLYFTLPETFGGWLEAVRASDGAEDVLATSGVLVTSLFYMENLTNPLFYLFLVLAVSVASHMSLSPSDIKGARSGLITMYLILVIFNLVTLSARGGEMGIKELFLNDYNIFVLSISVIAVLFAGVASGIAFLLYKVKSVL